MHAYIKLTVSPHSTTPLPFALITRQHRARSLPPAASAAARMTDLLSPADAVLGAPFDPLADAGLTKKAEEEKVGKSSADDVHIRIQQRNGKKSLTTVRDVRLSNSSAVARLTSLGLPSRLAFRYSSLLSDCDCRRMG
jgi:hypothetical protein